jgi:hypothetical protein
MDPKISPASRQGKKSEQAAQEQHETQTQARRSHDNRFSTGRGHSRRSVQYAPLYAPVTRSLVFINHRIDKGCPTRTGAFNN